MLDGFCQIEFICLVEKKILSITLYMLRDGIFDSIDIYALLYESAEYCRYHYLIFSFFLFVVCVRL